MPVPRQTGLKINHDWVTVRERQAGQGGNHSWRLTDSQDCMHSHSTLGFWQGKTMTVLWQAWQSIWRSWSVAKVFQNLGVGLSFAILFMVSINLASLPGKITAIWLPAALTLGAMLRWGPSILPGVFVGAFAIVVMALWDVDPPIPLASLLFASLVFALSETLQPLLAVICLQWLRRRFSSRSIPSYAHWFKTVPRVSSFIVAAIVAPMLPALLGTLAWFAAALIQPQDMALTWLTWWLPAAMAHLIFVPPLLLLNPTQPRPWPYGAEESIALFCAFALLLYLTFGRGYVIDYMFLPLLILAVFRLGLLSASLCLAIIAFMAIYATNLGLGSFVRESPHQSFIFLQSFLAVLSLTILVLSAVIAERQTSQQRLQQTLASLEMQVEKRTEELQKSENILTGFFSASPIGMGILDENLRFVRINPVLADISPTPILTPEDATAQVPELAAAIQAAYQQVMTTQVALIDQEIDVFLGDDPPVKRTWLLSCFPIQGEAPATAQVGLVLLEISDRKRLEATLQQQAEVDALTQIANRRAFDRHLQLEWSHCLRSQQPLALILCDVDFFKAYNDRYGHPMGDQCLIQVAQVLQQSARRPADLAVRYGGEEFALLLPNTYLDSARQIALSLQARLRELEIVHGGSKVSGYVTLSIGLVIHTPQPGETAEALVLAADQALYDAKRQGRDRLVISPWA